MDDNTLRAITALSGKLGIAADMLWGALLRQSQIAAVIEVVASLVLAIGCVWWFRIVRKNTTAPPQERVDQYVRSKWDDIASPARVSVFFFTLLSLILAYFWLSDAITAIINPEYWALKQIMSLVR